MGIEEKSRIGDFEGDTIIGAKHKGAILFAVDRHSKYVVLAKLEEKKEDVVVAATLKHLKKLRTSIHTITFDNGKEFGIP